MGGVVSMMTCSKRKCVSNDHKCLKPGCSHGVSYAVVNFTCRMAAQHSIHNFTLLLRHALRGPAGDSIIPEALAVPRAVPVSEPSVSNLHTHTYTYALRAHIFPQEMHGEKKSRSV